MEATKSSAKEWFTEDNLFKSDGLDWTFTTAWDHIPLFKKFDSCYDVDELLENNKIITKGMTVDSESGQSFYYFKSKSAGVSFIRRLNKFIDKKSNEVKQKRKEISDFIDDDPDWEDED